LTRPWRSGKIGANPNMRPGVEVAPWNAKVMDVIDPFGNRLSFNQPLEK
jgi:hypothetical protein